MSLLKYLNRFKSIWGKIVNKMKNKLTLKRGCDGGEIVTKSKEQSTCTLYDIKAP